MIEQSIQALETPRGGPVDPDTCFVCADLRRTALKAAKAVDGEMTRTVFSAMVLHGRKGHPEENRLAAMNLPSSADLRSRWRP